PALRPQGPKNPGWPRVAEEQVERERAFVEQGELALAQLERDRDTLSGVKERRTARESDRAPRGGVLEKPLQAERLTAERAAAQERFERYRSAVKAAEELAELNASHP